MFGDLISAGAKLIGGYMDRKAAEDANAQRVALSQEEYRRQKEFAKEGIRWKVKDAQAAGVHPLFALGASTSSYAPQSIGVEKESIGSALADMGQDVGRAVNATVSKFEKATVAARDALLLDGLKLDNDIKRASLASSLQKLNAPGTAQSPVPEADKPEERPQIYVGGKRVATDPGSTNAEEAEKRWGDIAQEVVGAINAWNDYKTNTGRPLVDVKIRPGSLADTVLRKLRELGM